MRNIDIDEFKIRLKELRKERGYTQEQLSALANVAHKTYLSWESGPSYPRIHELIQLCNALQCSPDYLLNGIDHDTYENKTVSEVTGLTDKAINAIKDIHDTGKIGDRYVRAPLMETLNELLESPYLFDLLDSMFRYKTDLPNTIDDSNAVNYMSYSVQENFRRLLNDVADYDNIKKNSKKDTHKRLF